MTTDPDNPERDPVLSAAWREHSAEMPPAAVDAAILAAAHRAVGSAPQGNVKRAAAAGPSPDATRPQRWWMPLAAAATIGAIALGILQTVPQEAPPVSDTRAPAMSDMPAATSPPVSSSRDKLAMQQQGSDAPRAKAESAPQAGSPGVPPPAAPTVRPAAPPASVPAKPAGKIIAQLNGDSVTASAPPPAAAPQPFPAEPKRDADESGVANDRASRALATQSSAAPTPEVRRQRPAPEAREAPALARSQPATPVPERMAAASDDKRQRNEVAQSAPMASGADAMAKKSASAEIDAAMRASATRDSAVSGSVMKDAAKPVDVDAWIVRIRKLHDDGKLTDAAKELVAMRAAVPDADRRLPAELRAWAATVKP